MNEVREAEIIRVARQLFVASGYAAVSMDDVAAKVGLSKVTMYRVFPTREELALAIMASDLEAIARALEDAPEALEPIARLRAGLFGAFTTRVELGAARIDLPPRQVWGDARFQKAQQRAERAGRALIDEVRKVRRGELAAAEQYATLRYLFSADPSVFFPEREVKARARALVELAVRALGIPGPPERSRGP